MELDSVIINKQDINKVMDAFVKSQKDATVSKIVKNIIMSVGMMCFQI